MADINHKKLIQAELNRSLALVDRKSLSGEEFKFIRKSLGLTREQFCHIFWWYAEGNVNRFEKEGMGLDDIIKFSSRVKPVIYFYQELLDKISPRIGSFF